MRVSQGLSRKWISVLAIAALATWGARPLAADTATYEQNANGQAYSWMFNTPVVHTDSGNYPNNNNWSQSETMATDGYGDMYETAPSNWSTPTYPNDSSTDVDIPGLPVTLNVSATIGNLEIDSSGAINMLNGNTLTVDGATVTDNGTITVNSNQITSAAILDFSGSTVSGAGTIQLNYAGNYAQLNGSLTQSTGHTIQGYGQINAVLTNNGTVNANVNAQQLLLQTSAMTNNNLFEATGGATMAINGITVTQGVNGQISASGATSLVNLTSGTTISGGTLATSIGGVIQNLAGTNTIDNVTNTGTLNMLDNTTLDVADNLIDNATITVNSNQVTASAILDFSGGTVSGSGAIKLNYAGTYAQLNGTLTQSSGHTIQGYGQINAALTNNGVVDANVNGNTLTLLTNAMTNNNIFEATGGATLSIGSITVTQGTDGQISASGANSLVNFTSGTTISGGILATSAGGVIQNFAGTNTIDNVTNTGSLNILDNTTLDVADNLIDNATIIVNSNQDTASAILDFSGGTVSGNGTINLNYPSIYAQLNGTLTQANGHTIQGYGQINAALTNNGIIDANVGGNTLTLQTSAMTNNNLFEAIGGAMLTINGITVTQGTSGQIAAATGSTVSLTTGAKVSGGTLNSAGTGFFQITGMDTLDSLTSNAAVNIPNGNTLNITGNLTDNGTIAVNSNQASSSAILDFNGGTVSGTGTIKLNYQNTFAQLNGTLIQASGHTIQGWGQINAVLTNQGIVNANVSGDTLFVGSSSMTNTNLMEATAGGILTFNNAVAVNNTGGQITANGGNINLTSGTSITGGTLTAVSPSTLSVSSYDSTLGYTANLNGVTISSGTEMDLPNGNVLTITGSTLTDNGLIVVNSGQNSSNTSLIFNANTLLTGSGTVKLNYVGSYAQLDTGAGDTLTQDVNHTIQGWGQINASLINFGVVNADVAGQTLTLQTNPMTNAIVFEATNGGTLSINAITVTQEYLGQISAATGSTVSLSSGATISGGILNGSGTGVFLITGTDTFDSLINDAVVNIPNGNTLNITGNLTDDGTIAVNSSQSSSAAILDFNGGTLSGTGTIQLNYLNTYAQLNGTLTQASGHTIQGWGQINAALTNQGIVNANMSGQTLFVNGTTTNTGFMEATNHGTLQFASGVLTNLSGATLTGGSYEVDANSTIILPGTVVTNAANITLGGAGYTFAAIVPLAANSGSFTVTNSASFTRTGTFNNSGTVTVGPAATLHITGALTNTGLINLTGGTLQLDQGVASSTILAQINAAYDHGAWDGTTGITSSLAEADIRHATAVGYISSGAAYTLMYTWLGDTDLNGVVNYADLQNMAPTGTTNATWSKGDFNYDGVVNADDYSLFMLGDALQTGGYPTVPEPSLAILLLFVMPFSSRKRRR